MPKYIPPDGPITESAIEHIDGVSTSVAGFLGPTRRGPVRPEPIASFSEFRRTFGETVDVDFDDGTDGLQSSYLAYAVAGFFENGGTRCYVARIADRDATAATAVLGDRLTVTACGPGAWGNDVRVIVDSDSGDDDRFDLVVEYWATGIPTEGEGSPIPDTAESYSGLSLNEDSPEYYATTINRASALVTVSGRADERPGDAATILNGGGDGGAIGADDYRGQPVAGTTPSGESRTWETGFAAFERIDEIAIVCAPDETALTGVTASLVRHCRELKDRIAILQSSRGLRPADLIETGLPNEAVSDGGYAAFYYPWITVLDPTTNAETLVPPGGHVAGVYARCDEERGVHEVPANEVVRGARELEVDLRRAEWSSLNPLGINCIRRFGGRGIRVWGARTTSPVPSWKYVTVRRILLYLLESIDDGTRWVASEPNTETLRERVRRSIDDFLTETWRDGVLVGTTPREAFFVNCDRSTMTQRDIDSDRLIVDIGVAPIRPGEYVVFRIVQNTDDAGQSDDGHDAIELIRRTDRETRPRRHGTVVRRRHRRRRRSDRVGRAGRWE